MAKTNLKINTKIEVLAEDGIYKSVVQDLRKEFMCISVPIEGGQYLPLKIGERIQFSYFVKNVGFFNCFSKVLRRLVENNISMYMLTIPSEEIKIQRRDFVRVSVVENICYRIIKEENEDKILNKGLMLNLSGSGMSIKINENLEIGDKLKIQFHHRNNKIEINGEIIRKNIEHGCIKNERVYGVKFEDMSEFKRDKIIKKVFEIIAKQNRLV